MIILGSKCYKFFLSLLLECYSVNANNCNPFPLEYASFQKQIETSEKVRLKNNKKKCKLMYKHIFTTKFIPFVTLTENRTQYAMKKSNKVKRFITFCQKSEFFCLLTVVNQKGFYCISCIIP